VTGNCSFLAIATGNYRLFVFFLWDYSNATVDYKQTTVDYKQTTVDYSSAAQHIYLLYRHYRHYSTLL
jgi:hypothetical protein